MNDIGSSIGMANIHLYADDKVLYCTADINRWHKFHTIKNLQLAFFGLQGALINLKPLNKILFIVFSNARIEW